jgi:methylated-DNA-[protein]-cysteine S-methyltransferase
MKVYRYYDSSVGTLLLVGQNEILEELHFPAPGNNHEVRKDWQYDATAFSKVTLQLGQYFAGQRTRFDLELQAKGTPFQRRVWQELAAIPFGSTASYGEIAKRIGQPKACRAVGMANGRNPIPIIIPCHRVIGKNGTLTGFSSGLSLKRQLLALEGIYILK